MEETQATSIENVMECLRSEIHHKYETPMRKLQEEEEKALSLVSDLEEILTKRSLLLPQSPQSVPEQAPATPTAGNVIDLSATARINSALDTVTEEFTAKQLLDLANGDGIGFEILWATFAPIFTRIKKRRKIIVIRPHHGNTPGLYKKP
jgi:hypothetical protein